jgi:hypothetical protein
MRQEGVRELKTGNSKLKGKRSHPDYTQITAYIRKETHEKVMREIYKRKEFSELLEELLDDWLKNPLIESYET